MQKVNENNVRHQQVEEICHSKNTGILSHHIAFEIANNYSIDLNTLKYYKMKK